MTITETHRCIQNEDVVKAELIRSFKGLSPKRLVDSEVLLTPAQTQRTKQTRQEEKTGEDYI